MRSTLTLLATVAILGGAADRAHAGDCGEPGVTDQLRDVERFAKRGGKAPEVDELCMEEASLDRRLVARFVKACDAILTRDPGYWPCVEWGVAFGEKQLGGVDLFLAIGKVRNLDPFGDGRLTVSLYLRLGDPRATAPVLAAWQGALADPRLGKKKFAHVWAVFRNNAVDLFTNLGGAPERAFLAAQLPQTKAKGLSKRMKQAIAAIDKRAATPKP